MQKLRSASLAVLVLGLCPLITAQTADKKASENNSLPNAAAPVAKYIPSAAVQASFEERLSLVDHSGRNYASSQEA